MRLVAALVLASALSASAQILLDRVLVRVNGAAITQTDLQAAVALGVVEPPAAADAGRAGLDLLIERQLLLAEVARFPPPDPAPAAIEQQLTAIRSKAGTRLDAVMQSTGVDAERLRDMARDTLRIQAYLRQRFGASATLATDEVREWLRDVRARATIIENQR